MAKREDAHEESWRKLGVAKGVAHLGGSKVTSRSRRRHLKPAAVDDVTLENALPPLSHLADERDAPNPTATIEQLLPGIQRHQGDWGGCYVLDKVYPIAHQHGGDGLATLLTHTPAGLTPFLGDEVWRHVDFRRCLWLDTETTGLSGAGTLAFMVGVAFWEGDALVVRQYFLRDHGDELAMLQMLTDLATDKEGVITFNGRSFDLPLLQNRYLMNRMTTELTTKPHLDLLLPARRLWRQRLSSCSLSSLEQHLLGVHRTHQDVPGALIPALYLDYLRSGDAQAMARIFYHNQIDMLSMITLTTHLMTHLTPSTVTVAPEDRLSLARWQLAQAMVDEGEVHLRHLLTEDLPLDLYQQTLLTLSTWLKRVDRRNEAVPLWQQFAVTTFDDVTAHVELAKYYEWHANDTAAALVWTERALALVATWSKGQAQLVLPDLRHRQRRLQRKLKFIHP